jgi:DNA invertase Pin-like site-specific DNA recombinase
MSEISKITPSHVSRNAIVYIRRSSATQVEHNRESTARQYALKQRALSGATAHQRNGFARMAAEVALAHVGIILGLEVSRLARNNTDWYRR